jgi:putative ABC transport system substrate-binding protein
MRRREFLAAIGGAVTWPTLAPAQQASARPIIGVLSPLSSASAARLMDAFRAGLRDLGYEDGRNITLEYRFADGAIAQRA